MIIYQLDTDHHSHNRCVACGRDPDTPRSAHVDPEYEEPGVCKSAHHPSLPKPQKLILRTPLYYGSGRVEAEGEVLVEGYRERGRFIVMGVSVNLPRNLTSAPIHIEFRDIQLSLSGRLGNRVRIEDLAEAVACANEVMSPARDELSIGQKKTEVRDPGRSRGL